MDFAPYHGNVTDDNGTVVPMATITVRHTDTGALARLYSTRDGSEPKSNPFQTDMFGNIQFFAAGGSYTIIAAKGGLERRWTFVPIGTTQEYDIDELAEFLNSGVMYYRTYAEMTASSPASFPAAAVVLSDADGSKNGYYTNNGSGWVFARTLPDSIARANIYSGDVNNPRANISAGINPSAPIVFFLDVEEQNTGSVTLAIDGIGSGVVLNAAGNVLSAGEWFGRVMLTREEDGRWRIVNDPASAIAAAASASEAGEARDAAVTAKDAAENSASAAATSADNASSSASSANTAKDIAETAANAAADSKSAAETSANSAASSASSASDSATSASASKDAAATSASAASDSANAAATSASSATAEAGRAKEEADRAEQAAASVEFPVSYKEQDLTPSEQAQAKKNIAADIVFNNKAELEAAEVSENVQALRLNGYRETGDGGGADYKRVASEPSHEGKIQSGDGAWWEIVSSVLTPEMFGAFGSFGTPTVDDGIALNRMHSSVPGLRIRKISYNPAKRYGVKTPILTSAGFTAVTPMKFTVLTTADDDDYVTTLINFNAVVDAPLIDVFIPTGKSYRSVLRPGRGNIEHIKVIAETAVFGEWPSAAGAAVTWSYDHGARVGSIHVEGFRQAITIRYTNNISINNIVTQNVYRGVRVSQSDVVHIGRHYHYGAAVTWDYSSGAYAQDLEDVRYFSNNIVESHNTVSHGVRVSGNEDYSSSNLTWGDMIIKSPGRCGFKLQGAANSSDPNQDHPPVWISDVTIGNIVVRDAGYIADQYLIDHNGVGEFSDNGTGPNGGANEYCVSLIKSRRVRIGKLTTLRNFNQYASGSAGLFLRSCKQIYADVDIDGAYYYGIKMGASEENLEAIHIKGNISRIGTFTDNTTVNNPNTSLNTRGYGVWGWAGSVTSLSDFMFDLNIVDARRGFYLMGDSFPRVNIFEGTIARCFVGIEDGSPTSNQYINKMDVMSPRS